MQLKYKQSSPADSCTLFHLMPETLQTQFVREQTDMLSEVASCFHRSFHAPAGLFSSLFSSVHHQAKYKEEGRKEVGVSLYSVLPDTPDTQHAKELQVLQSEVDPPDSIHLEMRQTCC